MVDWLIRQLRQPETWRGLLYIFSGLTGISLAVDAATMVVSAGIAVAGAIDAIKNDTKS